MNEIGIDFTSLKQIFEIIQLCLAHDNYELALTNINFGLSLFPGSIELKIYKGLTYVKQQKFRDGLAVYLEAEGDLELISNDPAQLDSKEIHSLDTLYSIANCYKNIGDLNKAFAYFNLLIINFSHKISHIIAYGYFERANLFLELNNRSRWQLDLIRAYGKILESKRNVPQFHSDPNKIEEQIIKMLKLGI
jgi:tetratricopeptide (TPR) repeat protein